MQSSAIQYTMDVHITGMPTARTIDSSMQQRTNRKKYSTNSNMLKCPTIYSAQMVTQHLSFRLCCAAFGFSIHLRLYSPIIMVFNATAKTLKEL